MAATIGGQEYQHATIDLQASTTGAPYSFTLFKSLNYEDGAEKTPVTDSQGQIVGYTIKPQKTDGSVTMLQREWWKFRAWLRLQAAATAALTQRPTGIGQVVFSLTVQYGLTLTTLQKDIIKGCMVQKEPKKSDDNQEALVVEIPLFLTGVSDQAGNRFVAYQ